MVAADRGGICVRSAAQVRLRARHGLAIYFGIVVVLSAVFQALIGTGSWLWVIPLMWYCHDHRCRRLLAW